MAEGGGLLNRYRVVKPYRGFESLRLRQICATAAALSGRLRPIDGLLVPNACQGRSHQFDARMMAGRGGQALVAQHQRSVEHFGEGHIDGVIGREIVPQTPDTREKEIVRVSAQQACQPNRREPRDHALWSISPLAAYRRMTCATSTSSRCGAWRVCRRSDNRLDTAVPLVCVGAPRAGPRRRRRSWRSRSARTASNRREDGVTLGGAPAARATRRVLAVGNLANLTEQVVGG